MAKVGCWSLETANVWVLRGHGEISVGEGFGGDRRESLHGWLVLLGSAFPMGVFFFFFSIDFCSGGILVSSGGMVSMMEAEQWRHNDRS